MKLKYKGTNPDHQRVRGKKNPKINIVNTEESENKVQEKNSEVGLSNVSKSKSKETEHSCYNDNRVVPRLDRIFGLNRAI